MSRFDFVGEIQEKILGANSYGVIVYDKEDGSIQDLTKINVLSQTGISCFACSYENDLCIIGYENGNIDVIDGANNVTNQPAIVNSNVVGDKAINDIEMLGEVAYLATGIGVIEFDLQTFNINEFVRLYDEGDNIELNEILLHNDTLYIIAENNLYEVPSASLFIGPELTAISTDGEPERFTKFFLLNDEVHAIYEDIVDKNDTIYRYTNGSLGPIEGLADEELRHIVEREDELLVTHRAEIVRYDLSFQRLETIYTFGPAGMDARMAVYKQNGDQVLVADGVHGVAITTFANQFNSTLVSVSSPRSGFISVLNELDGSVYAMPGGSDFTFNIPYLFTFEDEKWDSRLLFLDTNNNVRNTSGIERIDDKTYVSFDGSGLMVLNENGDVIQHFNEENAQIEDDQDGYYGLKGMAVDENDNLWMLNSRATSTLSVLDPEGNWTLISIPGFPKPIADDFIRHSSGILAFSLKDQGIILYDPADTPTETSDDRFVSINTSPTSGNLPNNTVNCMIEDQDGELWIGTDNGVGVIYNVQSMFSSNPEEVQRIIVNQDGYNGYLFESDAVVAMAVDGANRKWVAPRGAGLFLISGDGQQQLLHFTQDDSPLLNDNSSDLLIHPETGELFIATESGLQSFRTDATEPAENLSVVRVFPNPVKPGYNGMITFTGLTADGYLRVTDAAGNLIYETTSRGGTATWDGRDRSGAKVTSGIYLIQAADRSGLGGAISKLMFLN